MGRKRHTEEEVTIVDIASDGRGVGKKDGKVYFIKGTVPGDVVNLKAVKKRKGSLEGKVSGFVEQSDLRIAPQCQHFGICGGCSWQNLSYPEQLKFKQKMVEDAFQRIGEIDIPSLLPIVGSDNIFHYRNKLEFSFSNQRWISDEEIQSGKLIENRNALGFHAPGRYDRVVDIKECLLQRDPSNAIRNELRDYAIKHALSFYDIQMHEGLLRNIIVRTNSKDELMVILVFGSNGIFIKSLLEHLVTKFPNVTSLYYTVNQKKNDTINDLELTKFYGEDCIRETLKTNDGKKLVFQISPKSFFQTNPLQAEKLYNIALDLGNLNKNNNVLDLYCGTGTISCYVATMVHSVFGIEEIPEAIQMANENAQRNGINNIKFVASDVLQTLPLLHEEDTVFDTVITDPPRSGMHPKVIDEILSLSPEKIIYISCNPATQARDIKSLSTAYKINVVQSVDMFPHTTHVENIAILSKR